MPKTEDDARAIRERFTDRLIGEAQGTLMLRSDDRFAEMMFTEHGRRVRSLAVELPSLETVFLSLTGREIRDKAAGARARTLAFGKRGGEHTK